MTSPNELSFSFMEGTKNGFFRRKEALIVEDSSGKTSYTSEAKYNGLTLINFSLQQITSDYIKLRQLHKLYDDIGIKTIYSATVVRGGKRFVCWRTDGGKQVQKEESNTSLKQITKDYIKLQNMERLQDENVINRIYSATVFRGNKKFVCWRANGKKTVLKEDSSEVYLVIPDDTWGTILSYIHTSFIPFTDYVPESECFVAPIPEYHFIADENKNLTGSEKWFEIRIPHRVQNPDHFGEMSVKHGDINDGTPFQMVPQLDEKSPVKHDIGCFYQVNNNHIVIFTKHFTQFICTNIACQRDCNGSLKALVFGSIQPFNKQHISGIRIHLASGLYDIDDFRKKLLQREEEYRRQPITELDLEIDSCLSLEDKLEIKVKYELPWKVDNDIPHNQTLELIDDIVSQKKIFKHITGASCHMCRKEPSVLAHFDFVSERNTHVDFRGYLEILHRKVDEHHKLMSTKVYVTRGENSLQDEIESDAAKYMMHEITRFITTEAELLTLGINLGMKLHTIEQIRTDHLREIRMAGFKLAFTYFRTCRGTKKEKLDTFNKALVDMGHASALKFEGNNNV